MTIYMVYITGLFQGHPKIRELFDEADFKCAVLEIITEPKKGSGGGFSLVERLREQLGQSSTEIFPFFEACSRKVHKTRCSRFISVLF